jgi:tungstate transport system substrate-binding protein
LKAGGIEMKKFISTVVLVILVLVMVSCTGQQPAGEEKIEPITLATTTSTENSGLLAYILPDFEAKYNTEVKVVAVGTGQALEMGRNGDADVLLVHAKESELQFVNEGYGIDRHDVMYNDFVIAGPKDDPAGLKEDAGSDAVKALGLIANKQALFTSRGDNSGTHKKEMSLWKAAGVEPSGGWYKSVGKGMGPSLTFASEEGTYILTDRATYLSMKDNLNLVILVEGDNRLFNQYGVIKVNPEKHPGINKKGADKFVEWILSGEVQKMIGEFGKDKFGQSLFVPNGK